MFAVLTISKGKLTVNLSKILFFYEQKTGTRLEMEDGTLFDVMESYCELNTILHQYNALKVAKK